MHRSFSFSNAHSIEGKHVIRAGTGALLNQRKEYRIQICINLKTEDLELNQYEGKMNYFHLYPAGGCR